MKKMFLKSTALVFALSYCTPVFADDLVVTTPNEDQSSQRDRYDTRMNELSDREFKDRQEINAAVQYDHEVITTNEDLKDTVTGATMYDRNGNAIKRVESTVDTSKIHLKGEEGTTIIGVKNGEVSSTSTEAVNGSQLNDTNSNLDKVQAQVDTKVSKDEFVADQKRQDERQNNNEQAITEVNNQSITRDKQVLAESNAYMDRTRDELNSKINGVANKAYAGVAASMAMTGLSPVIHADKSAVSVAVGSYANQGAVAVGYSKRFLDDATTLRINAAVADRHFGGALGVTHEF